jgi:hypothetical protein
MKRITLENSLWLTSLTPAKRRVMLRKIFELADEKGWTVQVKGQHYGS